MRAGATARCGSGANAAPPPPEPHSRAPRGTVELMRSGHRRSAMRVRDGRVQKKNNWTVDRRDYRSWTQAEIQIDRKDPGPYSRHLITVAQLREFLELLPYWDELTIG